MFIGDALRSLKEFLAQGEATIEETGDGQGNCGRDIRD